MADPVNCASRSGCMDVSQCLKAGYCLRPPIPLASNLVAELRRASNAVFLALEQPVAIETARLFSQAATEIDHLAQMSEARRVRIAELEQGETPAPQRGNYVEGDYGDGAYRRDLAAYESAQKTGCSASLTADPARIDVEQFPEAKP